MMKFKNFKLHVLVDDKHLKEYKISDSQLGFSINRAKKSYVLDRKRGKIFSPTATFVAVPEPGTPYKIKYSIPLTAEGKPFKARVFIDGQHDRGYTHIITSSPFIKDGFCNQDCSKRYDLVFDKTEWVDTDESSVKSTKYGDIGVISVYFYRAKFVKRKESGKRLKLGRDLEHVKVSENKKNIDITFTTKFAEGKEFEKPKPSEETLAKVDKEPIAVLHLNYRPIEWFVARGISVKPEDDDVIPTLVNILDEFNDVTVKEEIEDKDLEIPIKIEKDLLDVPIKVEKDFHDIPTKDNEDQKSLSQVNNKNKRKYYETIELVDTDEDDTDEDDTDEE